MINNNEPVLATIKGEEAKKLLNVLENNKGIHFHLTTDPTNNNEPVIELYKS